MTITSALLSVPVYSNLLQQLQEINIDSEALGKHGVQQTWEEPVEVKVVPIQGTYSRRLWSPK